MDPTSAAKLEGEQPILSFPWKEDEGDDDRSYMVSARSLVRDVELYRNWQKESLNKDSDSLSLSKLRTLVSSLNLISGDICCTLDLMEVKENNDWFPECKIECRLEYHGVENQYELKELSWKVDQRRRKVLMEIASRELSQQTKQQSKRRKME